MTLEILLSNWRGWFVLIVAALTVVYFVAIAVNRKFKSIVLFYGIVSFFVWGILWFLAGGHYATMWRYAKWGTFNAAAVPLPEWFDGASVGFGVSALLFFSYLVWLNRATKIRAKNARINFNA